VQFLLELDPASEWQARCALLRVGGGATSGNRVTRIDLPEASTPTH